MLLDHHMTYEELRDLDVRRGKAPMSELYGRQASNPGHR